ncbi:MAG: hypothetical protein NC124_03925 [Clostridium sp.]|nr:hypothetical protein [Clostridium sp.]
MPVVPQKVVKGSNKNKNKDKDINKDIDKDIDKDKDKDSYMGEKAYQEALSYYKATKILEENREPEELFPPVLMNVTFACELFSKSLLYAKKSQEVVKGHSLKKLYDDFDQCDKELLQQFYSGGLSRLEEFIDDIADLFEVWRYRYEYKKYSTHYSFVLEYMELLNKVADIKYQKINDNPLSNEIVSGFEEIQKTLE